jgi:hypothetical protein
MDVNVDKKKEIFALIPEFSSPNPDFLICETVRSADMQLRVK